MFGVCCSLLGGLSLLVVSCLSFVDERRSLFFFLLLFFDLVFLGRWGSLRFVVRCPLRDYCCLLFVVCCNKFVV